VKVAQPNGLSSEELVENKGAYNAIVHESVYQNFDQIQAAIQQQPYVAEYRISINQVRKWLWERPWRL